MTDPTRALRQYLETDGAPAPRAVVESDLARGRRARRRRHAAAGTCAAALVAAAATALGLLVASPPASDPPVARPGGSTSAEPPDAALVSWTGRQLRGFVVARVPRGYVLQSVTATSLDIARAGDTTGPDVFVGKLVVTVTTEPDVAAGRPVTVDGRPGRLHVVQGIRMLAYTDGRYHVSVQAWRNIALTDPQLIEFAEGVHITAQVHPLAG